MTEDELRSHLKKQRWAVQASVSPAGPPQSALVGVVVGDRFEIVFDTLRNSRKAANLRAFPRIAFVIGGWNAGDECTVQIEAVADFPQGAELERLKTAYLAAFPDGSERDKSGEIVYVRARPLWIRHSDFSKLPPEISEFRFDAGADSRR